MIKLNSDFKLNGIKLINFTNLSNQEKDLVRSWRNHKEIRRWMHNDCLISVQEHKKFISRLKYAHKDFYWLLKDKEGQYLGVMYLNRIDTRNKNAYLGIYKTLRSRGIGHAIMNCLKIVAFDKASLHTLKIEVLETNTRAIAFYKKEGFDVEGALVNFVFRNGKWLDVIIMGLINKKS